MQVKTGTQHLVFRLMKRPDPNLRNSAYDFIRRKIINGDLAMGDRISEQAIAEEIGISRTPVRSAIHQLEAEGLLEQIPRYGTVIKTLDRQDLRELYELRIALEGHACEAAAGRIGEQDLDELQSLCGEMQSRVSGKLADGSAADAEIVARSVEADVQFHVLILRSGGNRRLMRSAVESRVLADWGRYARSQSDLQVFERVWNQHVEILRALQARNAERARKAMIEHLSFAKQNALLVFDRAQAEAHTAEVMDRVGAASSAAST